jgi:hypothetical protein
LLFHRSVDQHTKFGVSLAPVFRGEVMKALVFVLVFASVAVSSQVVFAQSRPPRTTHEGDTGPGPTPSTPGHYGSGDITHWDRPSRDVDHGSSWDDSSDSSSSYDSYDSYGSGGGGTAVYCAPKDLQSNVVTTDKALKALATSKDFTSAARFQKTVAAIGAMKNPAARADAYMKLAGIDSKDSKAVFAFVGAREARGTWIVELQRNTGLTESQAVKTAESLQGALRGGLN